MNYSKWWDQNDNKKSGGSVCEWRRGETKSDSKVV